MGGDTCAQYAGVKHTLFDRGLSTGDIVGIIAGSVVALGVVGVVIWILKKDTRTLKYLKPSQDDELPIEEARENPASDNSRHPIKNDQENDVREPEQNESVAIENEPTRLGANEAEIEVNTSDNVSPFSQIRIKRTRVFPRANKDI